jgi:hypothetical protein
MMSPVAYLREPEAQAVMERVTGNVVANADFLRSVDRATVVGSVFDMLVAAVTCLKHEGFHRGARVAGHLCASAESLGADAEHIVACPAR